MSQCYRRWSLFWYRQQVCTKRPVWMRSLAENKTVRIFFSFLACLLFLLNKMLTEWPDCSVTGPLHFEKKRVLERSRIQDQLDNICQLYGIKNCWILGESNRKLYAVLKWQNKYIQTTCHRFYFLTRYLLFSNVLTKQAIF